MGHIFLNHIAQNQHKHQVCPSYQHIVRSFFIHMVGELFFNILFGSLISNDTFLTHRVNACPYLSSRIHGRSNLVSVTTDTSGQKTVTGNSKRLKESAHYPVGFGLEIASLINPEGSPKASTDWGEKWDCLMWFLPWKYIMCL